MRIILTILIIYIFSFCKSWAFPVPSPLRLYMPANASYGTVILNNDSDLSANLALFINKWSQNLDGLPDLSPTTDVELSPSHIFLKPHQSTNIIIHVLKLPPPNVEKTYRMVMTGLDIPASGENSAMKATVDMPIFLGTTSQGEKFLLSEPIITGNDVRFNVLNDGMRVGRPDNIVVSGIDSKGSLIFKSNVRGWYVFPGSYMKYLFSVSNADCDKLDTINVSLTEKSGEIQRIKHGAWGNKACNNADISVSAFRTDRPVVKSLVRPEPPN